MNSNVRLSLYGDFDYVETDRDIPSGWADWDLPQREADLIKYFKNNYSGFADGAKLREMRSTIIEDYLAK